jgi:hypothetical protein
MLLDTIDHLPCVGTRQRVHAVTATARDVCRVPSWARHGSVSAVCIGRAWHNKVTLASAARQGGAPSLSCALVDTADGLPCAVVAVCLALTARPRVDQHRGGPQSLSCPIFAVCIFPVQLPFGPELHSQDYSFRTRVPFAVCLHTVEDFCPLCRVSVHGRGPVFLQISFAFELFPAIQTKYPHI